MKVTTYEGIVENGQVRITSDACLPENTRVYIVVPVVETAESGYVGSPRLVHPQDARDFHKEVIPE